MDLVISIPQKCICSIQINTSCPSVENMKVSRTVYINKNKPMPLEENANFK